MGNGLRKRVVGVSVHQGLKWLGVIHLDPHQPRLVVRRLIDRFRRGNGILVPFEDLAGNRGKNIVCGFHRLDDAECLVERDSAWTDVVDDLRWVDGGKSFTWISERDGWRHLYVVSRDGAKTRLVTPGAFDLHNPGSAFGAGYIVGVDSAAGWVYYTASPDDAA